MCLRIRISCTTPHSPLVKPDVRISLIRLSHCLHRKPVQAVARNLQCNQTERTYLTVVRTTWFELVSALAASLLGFLIKLLPQIGEFLRDGDFMNTSKPHRVVRSGTAVQAVLLSCWHQHDNGKAPSLHRSYPASSLLCASPTPGQSRTQGYSFPCDVVEQTTLSRVSQVPRSFFPRALSPTIPESPAAAFACCFTDGYRFQHLRKTDHSQFPVTRPNRVRFRYGSRVRRSRLRTSGITPTCARLSTCQTGNSHDGYLSIH